MSNNNERLEAIQERRRCEDESAYDYEDIDFLLARLEAAEAALRCESLCTYCGARARDYFSGSNDSKGGEVR